MSAVDTRRGQREGRPEKLVAILFIGAIGLAFLAGFVRVFVLNQDHLFAPTPEGMVLRFEVREVESPLDRITVRPSWTGEAAFTISLPATRSHAAEALRRTYPDGLEWTPAASEAGAGDSAVEPEPGPIRLWPERELVFDFDGDGVEDRVLTVPEVDYGWVKVASGADGSILYENYDPLYYESDERAFPLGDLDGDGYGELALVHPRMDRSKFDFLDPHAFAHAFMDVKSWVTVVSGSELAPR